MQNHVNLYNHYHYGDIFYARTIIIPFIKNNFTVNFYHNCSLGILEDIDGCNELPLSSLPTNSVNSWVGQNGPLDSNGCSFASHTSLAKSVLTKFNINIVNEEDFIPEIFFNKLTDKEKIHNFLLKFPNKKIVLVCNGQVHSGQSGHVNFIDILNQLCDEYREFIFVTTTPTNILKENIVYIGDYTQKLPDLLLIGYLSTFCDIIIGRASGPACYTHIKDNLMNPNKTFISFTYREHEGKWYCRSNAKQIWSSGTDTNHLLSIISNELQNKMY